MYPVSKFDLHLQGTSYLTNTSNLMDTLWLEIAIAKKLTKMSTAAIVGPFILTNILV